MMMHLEEPGREVTFCSRTLHRNAPDCPDANSPSEFVRKKRAEHCPVQVARSGRGTPSAGHLGDRILIRGKADIGGKRPNGHGNGSLHTPQGVIAATPNKTG